MTNEKIMEALAVAQFAFRKAAWKFSEDKMSTYYDLLDAARTLVHLEDIVKAMESLKKS